MSLLARGVVVCAAVTLTAGCSSGPVEIDAPELSGSAAADCRRLVAELPDSLAGQERRDTTGDTAYGAAWGDPAIVVTCGVEEPAGYDLGASCVQVDDAGWYVPDEVLAAAAEGDEDVDVTATELNYRPRVELQLPADYRPDGFGNAIGALTQVISREFERTGRCR
ncbi:DUF3515 domain-containing protein [Nocardioides sp. LMS-CY]|uniref:DUF3515 domain-containing protein n=1 Tax=Nocardioides sp. (strain LMS-CY) TaxID=2840457 RepID=UPI001C0087AD|nr:DUF3515 domain-containing protein [Nocardioides sp. LMS-CY]QWF23959.1 DUF3515 domain-containing protein [Nocardioides sp. LMS-CY]